MPRGRRTRPDDAIHHVLNRGNRRATIFHKPADYDAFFNLLCDTQHHVPMRILSVCLMPNHFHLVLWPERGMELSAYMQRLMNVHVRRYHKHYGTTGLGHIYQGRYKNFLVQGDRHLYCVIRYVEANALRCGLVRRAEEWRWSSLDRRLTPDGRSYLSEWPVPRPEAWTDYVNGRISHEELSGLRRSAVRGFPFGDDRWVRGALPPSDLESTVLRSDARRPRAPLSPPEF
jgi:putative transposase